MGERISKRRDDGEYRRVEEKKKLFIRFSIAHYILAVVCSSLYISRGDY